VEYRIDPDDRARFKRCRRQWDFASPNRRNLEPVPTLDDALRAAAKDALAVYYYPGTWDWQHELKQSLVRISLERSLADRDALHTAITLLDCYDAWATLVDDFAPVKIDHDVRALVTDPRDPERGLMSANGSGVSYECRVDLLAVDAADEYWVVRHLLVEDWQDPQALLRDEATIAACWAWEQDYIGMEIAGTVHNEVRIGREAELPPAAASPTGARVAQHEPSGGGRSIPQHRRASARAADGVAANRVEVQTAGVLRRTRVRRTRAEIDAAAGLIAAEALDMTTGPAVYPTPAAHCSDCAFTRPCLALFAGADPEPLLAADFRTRPEMVQPAPRLGQQTWGFGRGAAPPRG
jgi:hypothetical protein